MEVISSQNNGVYKHKKFGAQKRKRSMTVKGNMSAVEDTMECEQAAKRKQTNGFFRPWLDNENIKEKVQFNLTSELNMAHRSTKQQQSVPHYRANMARRQVQSIRSLSSKEQQKRDKNTMACLLSRRARQLEQEQLARQYTEYNAQHAAILEQMIRLRLYYKQLLQYSIYEKSILTGKYQLPEQQQQFLQQMSLSQQLMMFGCMH